MSLFTDILKGLPENAILRDKVREAEANQAKLETENAILKDDLHEAKAEIAKLQQQLDKFTHKDLDTIELELLVQISKIDYAHAVASVLQLNFFPNLTLERVRYHLANLEELEYIRGGVINRLGTQYAVTQNGRKLLLQKNLL